MVLDIKKKINGDKIELEYKKDPNQPIFDTNRNLLSDNTLAALEMDKICYLEDFKKKIMNWLAYAILILFALSLLVLIIVTLLCFKKFVNKLTCFVQNTIPNFQNYINHKNYQMDQKNNSHIMQ